MEAVKSSNSSIWGWGRFTSHKIFDLGYGTGPVIPKKGWKTIFNRPMIWWLRLRIWTCWTKAFEVFLIQLFSFLIFDEIHLIFPLNKQLGLSGRGAVQKPLRNIDKTGHCFIHQKWIQFYFFFTCDQFFISHRANWCIRHRIRIYFNHWVANFVFFNDFRRFSTRFKWAWAWFSFTKIRSSHDHARFDWDTWLWDSRRFVFRL